MMKAWWFVFLCWVLLWGPRVGLAQEEGGLNFCDIPCVNKIYKQYCGDAKCTTGASDYPQIFTLCTNTCAAAVNGEVMIHCLTETVPERTDWDAIQASVLQEVVEFCAGYEQDVDPEVAPLKLDDVDRSFLRNLFDEPEPEPEPETSQKKKKKGKGKKKKKKNKRSRKNKQDRKEEAEEDASEEREVDDLTPEEPKVRESRSGRARRRNRTDDESDGNEVETVTAVAAVDAIAESPEPAAAADEASASVAAEDLDQEVLEMSLEDVPPIESE